MMDSRSYRNEFEGESLDKILQERDRIVKFMKDFETHNLPSKYYERDTSPEEVYHSNILYLKEICDLIIIKMNQKDPKPKAAPFLAIEEILSRLDESKHEEFLSDLKIKDSKLYEDFMEWKMIDEG